MVNSNGDIARNPQAFEAFLIEQGYAPPRARSIAVKGFAADDLTTGPEIAALVDTLKARKAQLEQKRMLPSVQLRVTGLWSPWERVPAFTLAKPTSFKLLVSRFANSLARNPLKGPLFLEFYYMSPTGRQKGTWQSNGNGIANSFMAAAGTQEISIRGKTIGFDQVKVSFLFR
ncbi:MULTISPECIES: hypothetical protein [Kordiimonas]|jgi:hypothetical protein|uniref:hypothetical protein n=1 Tax=Kordiimonas TaxID=288021 RepID=UPI00257EE433|nr:hypothetical protein [Kordiimonas sp. UBA4487]